MMIQKKSPKAFFYINDKNIALMSSIEAGLGFPGAHASLAASALKASISSIGTTPFKDIWIPTSSPNCLTAATANSRTSSNGFV